MLILTLNKEVFVVGELGIIMVAQGPIHQDTEFLHKSYSIL